MQATKTTNTGISSVKLGRITGIFYLLIIVGGLSGSMLLRGNLINPEDPLATFHNLLSGEGLYRLGFLSDLIMVISDVMVSLLFYYLLRPAGPFLAVLAAGFRLMQSAVLGANLINLYKPLLLLGGSEGMDTVGMSAPGSEILRHLSAFDYGYLISGVFFSINCFMMAVLLRRSELFPSILGIMIFFAALGYTFNWFAYFMVPDLIEISEMFMLFTAVIAELALCLWLIIKGSRRNENISFL